MKIKKLIFFVFCIITCLFIAVCMIGCSSTYTVTIMEKMDNVIDHEFKLKVKSGETVTMSMLHEKYRDYFKLATGFLTDRNFYTDEACLTKFVGAVNKKITLYYGTYNPEFYIKVLFNYNGEEYTIFRDDDATLAPIDFSRSAYGYGEPTEYTFYSDEERTILLDLTEVKMPKPGMAYRKVMIYVADAQ